MALKAGYSCYSLEQKNLVKFKMTNLLSHLTFLYGADKAPQVRDRAQKIIANYRARVPASKGKLTERDSMVPDAVSSPAMLLAAEAGRLKNDQAWYAP